ncbi:hypothetical protein LRK24_05050 [Rhodanobacter denitrificans]|uniref:DUF6861 domain-containing protein n=1 Tax=Rhodanobacter denitrificans TaxID=666685 RepID=UPI00022D92FC|nr:hypothetical protein [Rhodanobacter denitrificans]EIL99999.1 hypothetical protein UUC_14873 [Rhodanobacter denitrificans]UJM85690.1 hypothetical protein LRJ86_12990 [Rhodanobacter denitrificans]UJM91285.1 hypothetical protein LRK24_05050 [Rhodanobacter denitrificans]
MRQAIRLSEGLAVCWILRNFRDLNLQGVVNDIVEVLRQCLIVMLTSTGGAALIGGIAGGVGTGAGAQVGEWILIAMGLKALAEYVVNDMPGIARDYWASIHQAWLAATPPPLPQQPVRVDRLAVHHAAEKIARATSPCWSSCRWASSPIWPKAAAAWANWPKACPGRAVVTRGKGTQMMSACSSAFDVMRVGP